MRNPALTALRLASSWQIARRSTVVMLFVGTLLNLINQGDVLLSPAAINWWKVALTYCVPFCVATFGAYSAYRASEMKQA